ncbi:hypothetical protein NOF04DRAFT_1273568 [Fusarium oxysporum II5]|nr:hypothetical protein NOF04DRAFT_1273568 [Fusarium oxysporum II5]
MGSFILDTYLPPLRTLRDDIGLQNASSRIPLSAFDETETTRAQTESMATDLPLIGWVQSLMTRAAECEINWECEATRNGEIDAKILEQASRKSTGFVSHGPVDFRYSQAAQIIRDSKPREAPSKIVDFCMIYKPEGGIAVERAIEEICQTRPAQSINHTDLGTFVNNPSRSPSRPSVPI